ncbi:MAG: branched-chain amino acid ABC transporter permease [Rhodospirillales bacterium]|nr:MAG: branched-chain amino acid ABC transporter permease [Rhodospirillales bacterium]
MPRRAAIWCALGLGAAVVYPLLFGGPAPLLWRSSYALNVAFLILFAAFIGQSWNVAGGFAGQTSFGHVVFFGTGAYVSTILHVTWGWNPWAAWPMAAAAGAIVGWLIATLSFRAGLRGSYFALITLAFAEAFRILANSAPFTRGGLGMLITADPRAANFQFRDPVWFYYVALALCVASLALAWWLTRSRFGARLVAIRENEDAARALGIDVFREKVRALTLSGAMCAAGGTVYAQKYLYIDPSIAFGVDKSVEMLLVSMIGGAGTVFGPLIGATALHLVGEVTRDLGNMVPGVKNAQPLALIVYGVILIAIVRYLPDGLMSLFRRARRRGGGA